MRIATINRRLSLIVAAGAVNVHTASGGRFGPSPADAYGRWAEFTDWAGVSRPGRGRPRSRWTRSAPRRPRRGRCSGSG